MEIFQRDQFDRQWPLAGATAVGVLPASGRQKPLDHGRPGPTFDETTSLRPAQRRQALGEPRGQPARTTALRRAVKTRIVNTRHPVEDRSRQWRRFRAARDRSRF